MNKENLNTSSHSFTDSILRKVLGFRARARITRRDCMWDRPSSTRGPLLLLWDRLGFRFAASPARAIQALTGEVRKAIEVVAVLSFCTSAEAPVARPCVPVGLTCPAPGLQLPRRLHLRPPVAGPGCRTGSVPAASIQRGTVTSRAWRCRACRAGTLTSCGLPAVCIQPATMRCRRARSSPPRWPGSPRSARP